MKREGRETSLSSKSPIRALPSWEGWSDTYDLIKAEIERLTAYYEIVKTKVPGSRSWRNTCVLKYADEVLHLVKILGSGDEELMKAESLRIRTNQFYGLNPLSRP